MNQVLSVVQRFIADMSFRAQLIANPDLALAGYNLSQEERRLVEQELGQAQPSPRPGKPIASVWS